MVSHSIIAATLALLDAFAYHISAILFFWHVNMGEILAITRVSEFVFSRALNVLRFAVVHPQLGAIHEVNR